MPKFDYSQLLWGERQIRSVANVTCTDARDFRRIASEIGIKPKMTIFVLDRVNEALAAVKIDSIKGSAVILP